MASDVGHLLEARGKEAQVEVEGDWEAWEGSGWR